MSTLPIIDITPWTCTTTRGTAAQKLTSEALHNACLKYGFFYLKLDGWLDPAQPDELLALGRTFFHQDQSEKDRIGLKNQDGARGYQRLQENVTMGKADNHEGVDFYKPVANPDKTKPVWGENQWPSVPQFKERYERWVETMKALGLIVMEAMALGLGMTDEEWKDLKAQVDDSFWVMRVIGYPQLPNDHDGFSCGAHKDYGCLTFLYADPTPNALQVFLNDPSILEGSSQDLSSSLPQEQGPQEGIWINADPLPGCCVCNIGEMWEIWTNGLYKSTLHRVLHRGTNYRVSLPFFFEPNFEANVRPLAAALRIQGLPPSTDELELKKSTVYGDFLLSKVGSNFAKDTGESQGRY